MTPLAAWTKHICLPSSLEAAERLVSEVVAELERREWPSRDVFGVHLAFEEALVNAIEHGNQSDPGKHIFVLCEIDSSSLVIVVRDEGAGFDLAAVPDPTIEDNLDKPSGRGIMLIRNFMSHAEYLGRGNELRMVKHRDYDTCSPG